MNKEIVTYTAVTNLLSHAPPLCNTMDYILPVFFVCEISQARIQEWVPFPSPKYRYRCRYKYFPSGGLDGRESACSAGDPGWILGLGRSPGEENGIPPRYPCLESSMDRGSLVGYSPQGHKESGMTEVTEHTHIDNFNDNKLWKLAMCSMNRPGAYYAKRINKTGGCCGQGSGRNG